MNGSPSPSENGFRPPWLLRNRHVQTILGHFLSGPPVRHPTRKHRVAVSDGDQLVLHDAVPDGWQTGDRLAVLIHGLGGSHDSGHLRRLARRLLPLGIRTVRVDLRGCGDGLLLARRGYHAGCSDDLRTLLAAVHAWSPTSPILLVGISLGGNVVLKLAGEAATQPVPGLSRVAVMGPPIDLHRCSAMMARRRNRLYDRHFAASLLAQAVKRQRYFPDLPRVTFPPRLTIRQFDALYTAPRSGFRDVDDYYTRASAAPFVARVSLPALILTARDDPFVAVEPFEALTLPVNVELRIIEHGGHLGFLGSDGAGGMRWAERRVVEWLLS
jgi:predicted alpha/beta-fold hydrolase